MAKDETGLNEIEEYAKKLSANPESLVFVPLAEAYRKNGMQDDAIKTCHTGLQLHPGYMSARMVLGRAYMDKEMFEEAADEFRKVAAADVNNIMAHSLLGQIYMKQDKFANAIEEYQKVLSLNPDDQSTQQMLNKALEVARQHNASRAAENSAPTGTTPKPDRDKKQDMTRAEELSRQGDIESAIKLYQLILETDPENLVVRQRLRDLELRRVQASTERKNLEKNKPEAPHAAREKDNDKITSDDILSVMKETGVKFTEKMQAESARGEAQPVKAEPAKSMAPKAEPVKAEPAKPMAPKAEPAKAEPAKPMAPKAEPVKTEPAKPTAPKAEPVKTEPAKPMAPKAEPAKPGAAIGATDSGKLLLPALQQLAKTEGILGGMLLDVQGTVLANTFKSTSDLKEIVETVKVIFGKTEKSVQAMDHGKQVNQILITGEKGLIIFNKLGSRILVILADSNINIGKLRLAMNELVKALR